MTYTSVPVTVEATRFTGSLSPEITGIAGDDLIEFANGRLWVRNAAGPWEVRLGDWVTRAVAGGPLVLKSQAAWEQEGFAED